MQKLVIVESPAKANTINKYLGKDYKVIASIGHVRDVKAKNGAIDPDNDFSIEWEIQKGKEKQIKEIEKLLKNSQELYLATDPDREGEAISWHINDILKNKNALKDIKDVKRIVFHEITKKAVEKAIENPRTLDENLIEAYLARRALDFLVGFNISPVLWRKLPGSKSAGRVQSVALRLICERENEIESFNPQEYWTIDGIFINQSKKTFKTFLTHLDGKKLDKFDINTEDKAKDAINKINSQKYIISSVEKKETYRSPVPPFTTSTMQQEASRKLRLPAKITMRTAQNLYEGADIGGSRVGLITYMRTDSVNLSSDALKDIRNLIGKDYGASYLPKSAKVYSNKTKNAQEAHEAIRPTDITLTPKKAAKYLERTQLALYELIWKRTVASQMQNAVFDQVTADVLSENKKINFHAVGTTLKFDGFLKVYREDNDDEETKKNENRLPTLSIGESAELKELKDEQHFTKPPARYTEASLVKKLEALGIGRPSTYASMLSVIQDRQYAKLEQRKFFPEERGRIVTSFLEKFFTQYVEYDFTAEMEDTLDDIANGKKNWKEVLKKFWGKFIETVNNAKNLSLPEIEDTLDKELANHLFQKTEENPEPRKCPDCKDGKLSLKLGRFGAFIGCSNYPECKYTKKINLGGGEDNNYKKENSAPTELGKNEETGELITLRTGPYGPYIQLGEQKDKKHKVKRISIPKNVSKDDIDLEKAKFLLSLPREIGKDDDEKPIILHTGKFGPYLKKEDITSRIPKEEIIFNINLDRAKELIANGRQSKKTPGKELGLHPKDNKPVFFKTGRYGPYIEHGKTRASVPKSIQDLVEQTGEEINLDQALNILKTKKIKGTKKNAKS